MKQKINVALVPVLLAAALLSAGCHWQKSPKGFPQTVPLNVIVTKDAKPLAGVDVLLTPEVRKENAWTVSGKTDDSGTAAMQTIQGTFVRAGAPTEKFHVTLMQVTDVESMMTVVNDGSIEKAAAYAEEKAKLREEHPSEVPEFFGLTEKTPLTLEVTKETKEYQIELNDYSEPE